MWSIARLASTTKRDLDLFGWLFRRRRPKRSVSARDRAVAIGGDAVNSSIKIGLDEVGVVGALQAHRLCGEVAQLYAEKERLERALSEPPLEQGLGQHRRPDPLLDIYGAEFLAKVRRLGNPERQFELVEVSLALCERLKMLGGTERLQELINVAEGVLRIYSREEAPYQWAAAKSHIGHSQVAIALGTEADEVDVALFRKGAEALAEAVACYDRDAWREEFARASLSLALALDCLADFDPLEYPKKASVGVLERALAVCPPGSRVKPKLQEQLSHTD